MNGNRDCKEWEFLWSVNFYYKIENNETDRRRLTDLLAMSIYWDRKTANTSTLFSINDTKYYLLHNVNDQIMPVYSTIYHPYP